MTRMMSELGSRLPAMSDDWRHPLARHRANQNRDAKLIVAGAAVVGIGLLTWYYMGPDLRRYLKIHGM